MCMYTIPYFEMSGVAEIDSLCPEAALGRLDVAMAAARLSVTDVFMPRDEDNTTGRWDRLCADETRIYYFSDGSQMDARVFGADFSDAELVVMKHHGTPGSGSDVSLDIGKLWDEGIRVVAPNRSGCGRTTSMPGRTVADIVPKFAAIMRYETRAGAAGAAVGQSGGTPYTAECLIQYPDLFQKGGILAGLVPRHVLGTDFTAGMSPDNVRQHGHDMPSEQLWAESELLSEQLQQNKLALGEQLLSQQNPDGSRVMVPADVSYVRSNMDELSTLWAVGMRQRGKGKAEDMEALKQWERDVHTINQPTLVWHGDLDPYSPIAHGRWLAREISGAVDETNGYKFQGHFGASQIMMSVLLWAKTGVFVRPPGMYELPGQRAWLNYVISSTYQM